MIILNIENIIHNPISLLSSNDSLSLLFVKKTVPLINILGIKKNYGYLTIKLCSIEYKNLI